jgi:hypothetical protein
MLPRAPQIHPQAYVRTLNAQTQQTHAHMGVLSWTHSAIDGLRPSPSCACAATFSHVHTKRTNATKDTLALVFALIDGLRPSRCHIQPCTHQTHKRDQRHARIGVCTHRWSQTITELRMRCHIQPGVPVHPMLAQPTRGITEVSKRIVVRTCVCVFVGCT